MYHGAVTVFPANREEKQILKSNIYLCKGTGCSWTLYINDLSSCFSQMRQCPFCRFRHTDLERLRSHVINQHAVQPALRCPLCQDTLHSVALLRTHLAHLHSVTADCTQKLISTVRQQDSSWNKCSLNFCIRFLSIKQKTNSSCTTIFSPVVKIAYTGIVCVCMYGGVFRSVIPALARLLVSLSETSNNTKWGEGRGSCLRSNEY